MLKAANDDVGIKQAIKRFVDQVIVSNLKKEFEIKNMLTL